MTEGAQQADGLSQAEPKGSALRASIPSAWKAVKYECATTEGMKLVSGHSNGIFGIDERDNLRNARRKAWAIIHLGTGYAAANIQAQRQVAQRFADELARAADWNFTSAEDARFRSGAARDVFADNEDIMLTSVEVGPPWIVSKYPEERQP